MIPPKIDYHSIYLEDVCSMIHHWCVYVLPKLRAFFNDQCTFIYTNPLEHLSVADVVCPLSLMIPA